MKLTREVKVAIIAIIILAGSIWGYSFLKGKNILSPTNNYYIAYDEVTGIIESGAVYLKGYQVGNINQIIFDADKPNKFLLNIVLRKDLKIPLGTKVMAKETNLIAGAKDLQLIFSDSKEYHSPGDTLAPAYDPGLLGILDPIQTELADVIEELKKTLKGLSSTLDDEFQNNLNSSLSSLNSTLSSLSYSLSPSGSLGKSLSNVETITGSLAENSESMGTTLQNLESITSDLDSANIDQTLLKLDSTMIEVNAIMAKINNGEGTAGLIVNDSSLYMNLASASSSLDSLLVDLKENLKRYVHLSLFGGKKD